MLWHYISANHNLGGCISVIITYYIVRGTLSFPLTLVHLLLFFGPCPFLLVDMIYISLFIYSGCTVIPSFGVLSFFYMNIILIYTPVLHLTQKICCIRVCLDLLQEFASFLHRFCKVEDIIEYGMIASFYGYFFRLSFFQ